LGIVNTLKLNATGRGQRGPALLYLAYFIYFFCGLAQCLEGVFLPEFKEYFRLTYQQQMYIVFAKNLPFLAAVAVALLVRRFGYKNALAIAMFCYATGTLLLVPGLRIDNYRVVLCGFLIVGTGFTIHMVAGNPLMRALGPSDGASSRLNFGNALGAVAQIIAPAALTFLIPASVVEVKDKLVYIETIFLVLGVALIGVACATILFREVTTAGTDQRAISDQSGASHGSIWRQRKVLLGFFTIFLVLGVEAGLFSFFRNYVEASNVAGLTSHASQRLFTVYFALFAAGRLVASWVQEYIRPETQLQVHFLGAILCLTIMIFAQGRLAVVAFLVLGFFVSIFFPTLYAIAMDGIGDLAPQASGLLTLGFLGCAIIPVVQGALADSIGLQNSFVLGMVVYLLASAYTLLVSSARLPLRRAERTEDLQS